MIDDHATPDSWSGARSAELYHVNGWGDGYFGVSPEGTVVVYPEADESRCIDLHEVTVGLAARGLEAPVILRFPGVLRHRMQALRDAFDATIADLGYQGSYSCVYPIKVNHERHLCEAVCRYGAELGFGIEVGSKPELLAGLALTAGLDGMPMVCNGFKDAEYVETVVLAAKMGRNIIPVIERAHELELIIRSARNHACHARFGMRAQLAATGVGRWAGSSGMRGKFGLTVGEILHAVDDLAREEMLNDFRMLHCHVGSQVFDIRVVKQLVSELAHLYVELHRAGAPIEILDFGGGLGVDYDGSQSASESSVNYTLDQYAADIVHRVQSICDEAGVPHPQLMTESGRAIVAHSSVLVAEVIGRRVFPGEPDQELLRAALSGDEPPQPLIDAHDAFQRCGKGDPLEIFADVEHALAEARNLFSLGYMDLHSRAACEELFWAVGHATLEHFGDGPPEALADLPDQLRSLPDQLADLYFLNLSIFQSLLDSWGVGQLFPIMPLHRLREVPTRRGVLADITCDADGRIDRFPGRHGPKSTLAMHPLTTNGAAPPLGEDRYYLGIFLVGAYQETLGDLHNLLGDTHVVHIVLGEDGRWRIDSAVEGDSVRDVLSYVQYDVGELRSRLRHDLEQALEAGRLTLEESASLRSFLDESLRGYTYLE